MQTQKVIDFIVEWLKEYQQKSNTQGFVVGISGGIDSAVTSTLCALTGQPVLCVEMPIHQPESHVSRGREHIEALRKKFPNVSSREVDLTDVFDGFKSLFADASQHPMAEHTLANTRSRLRMVTLYHLAGLHGYLVAGTGNKVEDFGIGFYTKYGDGGVDLSPIADLMKSEVYTIGKHLGVPVSILQAPPSDGLFADARSDEDQIGASYDELEWAMLQTQSGKTLTNFTGREQEVIQIYQRFNKANQHKMNPIPVCVIPENLKHA